MTTILLLTAVAVALRAGELNFYAYGLVTLYLSHMLFILNKTEETLSLKQVAWILETCFSINSYHSKLFTFPKHQPSMPSHAQRIYTF